jgi:hypothetical protein
MHAMEELRRRVEQEVFDYRQLMDVLRDYSKPRDKIGALMAAGSIVRVKKGLYVFGDAWRRRPVCRELLSNLAYGPSYVSLEYALSYHGLIPERVNTVTCVTVGKSRRFQTPFGLFTYRRLPGLPYAMGFALDQSGPERFLMATPEKALADFVWADRRFRPSGTADYAAYLRDDLRMDGERLAKLDMEALLAIRNNYATPRIGMLVAWIQTAKETPP